jgi:hypothetical protein
MRLIGGCENPDGECQNNDGETDDIKAVLIIG